MLENANGWIIKLLWVGVLKFFHAANILLSFNDFNFSLIFKSLPSFFLFSRDFLALTSMVNRATFFKFMFRFYSSSKSF